MKYLDTFFDTSLRRFQNDFYQAEDESITEDDDKFLLALDLPGVEEAAIEVTVDNHRLQITSERNGRKSSCAFRLADTLDEDNISAAYKNGVLTVTIPKQAKAQPRRIELSA